MDRPVAIVTGAGSGIGRATAELLAQAGYRVALVGRTLDHLEGTRARCVELTPVTEALVIVADVAVAADAERVVHTVVQTWTRVDVLVNNAALLEVATLDECAADHVERVLRTNLLGPFALVHAAWPHLQARRAGHVVNVSSVATRFTQAGLAAYTASKAALESLTRSIALEGAPWGIEAHAIAPGPVETPMLDALRPPAELPTGPTLAPREVAELIVACALGQRPDDAARVIELMPGPRR